MTADRPRLLWVTDEAPHPRRGVGNTRQFHLLKRVAREVDVDLVVIGEPPDDELLPVLQTATCIGRLTLRAAWHRESWIDPLHRRLHLLGAALPGRPPTDVIFHRPTVEALRKSLPDLSAYDLVQVEHEHLAGLFPSQRQARWAITLHNLMSVRFRQRAAIEAKRRVRFLYREEAARARAWERQIVNSYDTTIVMSDEDARALPGPSVVVPNGVDLDAFPTSVLPSQPRMMFSASFNYEPNVDATVWACEDILPRIRHRVPGATIVLVGREPDARVVRLSSLPGVEAHFDVPDVFPYLRGARLAVVPIRQGSGTRLKALEAMAAARPIVGTTIGLEGLGLVDGRSAVIADSPDGLAAAAVRLLTDDAAAAAIAAEGRLVAERRFSWDLVARRYLDEVVGSALAGPARPAANYYEKP